MPRRNLIWVVAILLAAGIIAWALRGQPGPSRVETQYRFDPVSKAYQQIQNQCYPHLPDDRIRRGALEGMVAQLDPHSRYIPPQQAQRFQARLEGTGQGTGLTVIRRNGLTLVVGVAYGSAAHEAGIYPGDLLWSVDGRSVRDMDPGQVQRALGGLGEDLALEFSRTTADARVVSVPRRQYRIETVTGLWRDSLNRWQWTLPDRPDIAYVRVAEFGAHTGEAFRKAFLKAHQPQSLILDLRGNPGGMLPEAVAIANMLLRSGTIAIVRDRSEKPVVHTARAQGTLPEVAVIVLVDAHTASAAELLAGALRWHDRAVIVGRQTHGKGTLQTPIELDGGLGNIYLTTAEFFIGSEDLPVHRHAGASRWGVTPHVPVPDHTRRRDELAELRDQAQRLLPPPAWPATAPTTQQADPRMPLARRLISADPELAQALKLLHQPERRRDLLEQAALQRRRLLEETATRQADPETQPHD